MARLQRGDGCDAELGQRAHEVLGVLVNLLPLLLAGTIKRGLRLDGQLDFFWLDLFVDAPWQGRGQLNVALDLGGPFALPFGTVF